MPKPARLYESIDKIDLMSLWERGIRLLLIDADNTLAPWKQAQVSKATASWIASAKRMGFGLAIVSNATEKRLAPLSALLQIPAAANCRKPLPFALIHLAKEFNLPKKRCAVIGDQLLTDMLAGRLAGMHTFLVEPINRELEFAGTKINRLLESAFINLLYTR